MLQDLRDNSRGIVSYILIGFLVVVMALFGMESLFNWNPSADKAGEVNGERITVSELESGIQRKRQELLNLYGENVPANMLSSEVLAPSVLEELIAAKVISQAAKNNKMTIGEAEIWADIVKTPAFQDANGVFNNQIFLQRISQAGFTPATYLEASKNNGAIRQLVSSIANTGFLPESAINEFFTLSNQVRDFSYFTLSSEFVTSQVNVSAEEIKAFYDTNTARFTQAERVAVDYIELNIEDMLADITVTEEQALKQFEQNKANMAGASQERRVAHILIETNDAGKITEISQKLAAGEEFAALAKDYSDDFGSRDLGGDLGYTSGADLPAEFVAAMNSLAAGEVSQPVKTDAGTHFIKVSDIKSAQVTFEDVRSSIIDSLKRSEAENLFVVKLDQLRDISYNADDLTQVAQELGLKSGNTGLFTEQGGAGIAANSAIVQAAFSDDVYVAGNSSEPIELSPTHVVVIKKTADEPSRLMELTEVQEQIESQLKSEKVRVLIAERGSELIAEIRQGASIVDVAKLANTEAVSVSDVVRNNADLDPEVVNFAFGVPKPENAPQVAGGFTRTGDYLVVSVSAVKEGEDVLSEEIKAAITGQLTRMVGEGDFVSYQSHLIEVADIERK